MVASDLNIILNSAKMLLNRQHYYKTFFLRAARECIAGSSDLLLMENKGCYTQFEYFKYVPVCLHIVNLRAILSNIKQWQKIKTFKVQQTWKTLYQARDDKILGLS